MHDFIFTAGTLVFIAALLPTVFGRSTIPLKTSLPTAIVRGVFTFNLRSLHLYFSTMTELMTTACWTAIAVWRRPLSVSRMAPAVDAWSRREQS